MSNNVVSLQINTADIMVMNRVDQIVLDPIRTYACTRTARTGVRVTLPVLLSSPAVHATIDVVNNDAVATSGPYQLLRDTPLRPSVPLPSVLITAPTWSALANNALNLDDTEQPLTYASGKARHNAQKWDIAEAEEVDRLLSTDAI